MIRPTHDFDMYGKKKKRKYERGDSIKQRRWRQNRKEWAAKRELDVKKKEINKRLLSLRSLLSIVLVLGVGLVSRLLHVACPEREVVTEELHDKG